MQKTLGPGAAKPKYPMEASSATYSRWSCNRPTPNHTTVTPITWSVTRAHSKRQAVVKGEITFVNVTKVNALDLPFLDLIHLAKMVHPCPSLESTDIQLSSFTSGESEDAVKEKLPISLEVLSIPPFTKVVIVHLLFHGFQPESRPELLWEKNLSHDWRFSQKISHSLLEDVKKGHQEQEKCCQSNVTRKSSQFPI